MQTTCSAAHAAGTAREALGIEPAVADGDALGAVAERLEQHRVGAGHEALGAERIERSEQRGAAVGVEMGGDLVEQQEGRDAGLGPRRGGPGRGSGRPAGPSARRWSRGRRASAFARRDFEIDAVGAEDGAAGGAVLAAGRRPRDRGARLRARREEARLVAVVEQRGQRETGGGEAAVVDALARSGRWRWARRRCGRSGGRRRGSPSRLRGRRASAGRHCPRAACCAGAVAVS